jgi:uncharacterized protein YjbJ (UPF0337 family)
MGTRGKVSNQAQNLIAKVEETVGTSIGDDHMRAKGKIDQRKAAQKGVGEKVEDAASKLKWKPRMGRPQVVELGVVESVT